MRHGTEALNLKWEHPLLIKYGDETDLGLFVDGETDQRPLIARDRAIRPLAPQLELNPSIQGQTLDQVIEAKLDEYVFITELGTRAARANLARAFEALLTQLKPIYGTDGKKAHALKLGAFLCHIGSTAWHQHSRAKQADGR